MGMDQVVNIEVDRDNSESDIELCYWRKNYVLHSWMINNVCILSWFKNGRDKQTYNLENDEKLGNFGIFRCLKVLRMLIALRMLRCFEHLTNLINLRII